jgi:hypothetical protein
MPSLDRAAMGAVMALLNFAAAAAVACLPVPLAAARPDSARPADRMDRIC